MIRTSAVNMGIYLEDLFLFGYSVTWSHPSQRAYFRLNWQLFHFTGEIYTTTPKILDNL
jgi:hypothetical protein